MIARQLALTAGTHAAQSVLSIAASVVSARLLAPEGRGELAALLLLPALVSHLLSFGTAQAITFFTAADPRRAHVVLGTALGVIAVMALPILAVLPMLLPFLLGDRSTTIESHLYPVTATLALTLLLYGLPQSVFLGLRRYRDYNLQRLLPGVLYSCSVFAAFAGAGAVQIIWIYVAALATGGLPVAYSRYRAAVGGLGWDWALFGRLFPYSAYAWMSSLPAAVGQRLDQIVTLAALSLGDLGVYAVALGLGQLYYTLLTSVGAILLPHLAVSEHSEDRRRRLFSRIVRLTFLGATAGAVAGFVVLPVLIPWAFGDAFSSAAPLAQLLVFSSALSALTWVLGDGFRGLGLSRLPLYAELCALAVRATGFAAIFAHADLQLIAIVGLVGSTAGLAMALVLYHHQVERIDTRWLLGLSADLGALRPHLVGLASGMMRTSKGGG